MVPEDRPVWGSERLVLRLPIGGVQFAGLSAGQQRALARAYRGFLSPPEGPTVPCGVYRLPHLPRVTAAELTRDGCYALIQRYREGCLRITGVNFEAQMPLDPRHPARLGVARERDLPEPIVIENFLRVFSAHRALGLGGLVVHSAGFAFDGRAWIFPGYSNAGKTTLTRKAHTAGAHILSDDVNLLLPREGAYFAHGVPFTGEFGRTLAPPARPVAYPVAVLAFLEQGPRLAVEPLSVARAVARLLGNCPFVNREAWESERLFEAVVALIDRVPVVRLRCRRTDPIASILDTLGSALAEPLKPSRTFRSSDLGSVG